MDRNSVNRREAWRERVEIRRVIPSWVFHGAATVSTLCNTKFSDLFVQSFGHMLD